MWHCTHPGGSHVYSPCALFQRLLSGKSMYAALTANNAVELALPPRVRANWTSPCVHAPASAYSSGTPSAVLRGSCFVSLTVKVRVVCNRRPPGRPERIRLALRVTPGGCSGNHMRALCRAHVTADRARWAFQNKGLSIRRESVKYLSFPSIHM